MWSRSLAGFVNGFGEEGKEGFRISLEKNKLELNRWSSSPTRFDRLNLTCKLVANAVNCSACAGELNPNGIMRHTKFNITCARDGNAINCT